MRAVVAALAITACYSPSIRYDVPCGAEGACPTGQVCDVPTQRCVAPGNETMADAMPMPDVPPDPLARTLRFDSAAELGAGTLIDAVVEASGHVAPMPYAVGRIKLSGLVGDRIGDPATATWATVSNGTITGTTLSPTLDIDYSVNTPWGVGIAGPDNFTLLAEGELLLDTVGTWVIELEADDKGFIEIAPPAGNFARIVSTVDTVNPMATASYQVTTAGWHRIRAAVADVAGNSEIELRYDPPGGVPMVNIPDDHFRVRVDDLTGFIADAFDEPHVIGFFGAALESQPLVKTFPASPYGTNAGPTRFSVRWTGQIKIDVEGDYAFRIDTFQGHRMWLGGTLVADAFVASAQVTTTAPAHLVVGWHDVVLDVDKADASAMNVSLTIASGPELVGQPLPGARVRPVVSRVGRWLSVYDTNDLAVADDGTAATRAYTALLPASFTPTAIDASYEVDHPVRSSMSLVLTTPNNTNVTLLAQNDLSGSGSFHETTALSPAFAGAAWTFTVRDHLVDAVTGLGGDLGVTQIYTGGLAPFPTSARYESEVRDLQTVVALGAVTYQLRQGTTATAQIRSCDNASGCAAEPWTAVAAGAVPAITARRFVQLAVSIATNGDVPTALDWIELAYTATP